MLRFAQDHTPRPSIIMQDNQEYHYPPPAPAAAQAYAPYPVQVERVPLPAANIYTQDRAYGYSKPNRVRSPSTVATTGHTSSLHIGPVLPSPAGFVQLAYGPVQLQQTLHIPQAPRMGPVPLPPGHEIPSVYHAYGWQQTAPYVTLGVGKRLVACVEHEGAIRGSREEVVGRFVQPVVLPGQTQAY
ncbi:hypothetical protein EXIGLDRAFT_836158 [Exidia glandulosa HHB12029]|uniref:Uncharacterized protein n=1 Tax=Exidia glandulosa HHB12029 TaxID=1314781 RepID=A0A165I2E7_EXIGL|nr:hypothetical protein EXIGLDRAFT_836158 [Exidia glandulosa HHB12029]